MRTPLSVWSQRPAGRAIHSGDPGRPEFRWKGRTLAGATALLCALAVPPAVQAQAPYLVKDINPAFAVPTDSNPKDLVAVGSVLFFSACSGVDESGSATDCELWKSGGTEAGTVLVKDISPGTGSSSPYPDQRNVSMTLRHRGCAY